MSESVLYEVRDKVAIITLNRPEVHNAQNTVLLQELDECWTRAGEDVDVSVIVLKANGKNFSSGHDLDPKYSWNTEMDYGKDGIRPHYLWEQSHYFEYSRRWRNNPKPSIAAVQGACVAAGLMLCWPCDLIIASDTAWFSDPTIIMGVAGVEYHGHTWELGARKAKQLLFTADRITAAEAASLGMVNEVVALDELENYTMELAERISQHDPFALMMAKRSVNQALDTMGQAAALQSGFDLHEFQHTQCLARSESNTPVLTRDVKELKKNNTK